ncbi:MAG: ribosomal protein L16, partial [Elusimicrobia bacterium]|nr:ribosomal protein L16 [Elusimicrobiota bacterium]
RPGRMLFEVEGLTLEEAQKALKMAAYKLPIKTKFVAREHI